jgi:plasmid stabilization system protein ParE
MRYRVQITAKALHEIDEALGWLAERSLAAATRWYLQLIESIRSLEDNPMRCGVAPESEWYPGKLHQLFHGKRRGVYRILFEIRDDTVYILRVRHSAQSLLEPGEIQP